MIKFHFSKARSLLLLVSLRSMVFAIAALSVCVVTQANEKTSQVVLPDSATGWRDADIADINDGYQITLENHPGAYDPKNPDFLKNLSLARQLGLALAEQVTDSAGYVAAVQKFNVLIRDGHAGMSPRLGDGASVSERWPGFITVWRGNGLYVYGSETGNPAVGSQVVSCDGVMIDTLIKRNVFTFRGREDEPGNWWVVARRVFVDNGNPFVIPPKQCVFSLAGKSLEQSLNWTVVTEQFAKWRDESYNGETLPVGLSEPRKNLYWVAMPSFQPNEKERDAYRAMHDEVEQHRQRYLKADAIVIDLRENQGGSSFWSAQFAEALWGKARVQRRREAFSAKTQVWWRASQGNIDHMSEFVGILTKEKQLDGAEWARKASTGMQAALTHGERFFINQDDAPAIAVGDSNVDLPGDPPALKKPVYVVVPGQCASACLDALDTFTRFSNTILIGAPSSSDSTYMEVRIQALPSGRAAVIIPNKVYVDRGRANGAFYTPAIYVYDLHWSIEHLLKIVEADLTKKKLLKSKILKK